MFRPYMSGTSVLCRLRPTVTPFPLWTALPPAEYYEVIRLPAGHRPGSWWLLWPTALLFPLGLGSGLPCVEGFPNAWLSIRIPCQGVPASWNRQGLPSS